jgi:hypothetical protein
MTEFKVFAGVKIYIDGNGKFSATPPGSSKVVTKSKLAELEKPIIAVDSGRLAMDEFGRRCEVIEIVKDRYGYEKYRTRSNRLEQEYHYPYAFDADVQKKLMESRKREEEFAQKCCEERAALCATLQRFDFDTAPLAKDHPE